MIPAGVTTATIVGNASKYVSVEADVPTVQRFARNVMKNVPTAEMLKFAADVMSAKNVREEKETSVIAAKPASIVHPIFVIAEMVVPNVPRYVKDVRNSVKTVPEKFVQAADIAVTVLLITAGVQTVTCVETV